MFKFPNLSKDELDMLAHARTPVSWRTAVNKVLAAREGNYPPNWEEKIFPFNKTEIPPAPFTMKHAVCF
jgi:hypothetical protein